MRACELNTPSHGHTQQLLALNCVTHKWFTASSVPLSSNKDFHRLIPYFCNQITRSKHHMTDSTANHRTALVAASHAARISHITHLLKLYFGHSCFRLPAWKEREFRRVNFARFRLIQAAQRQRCCCPKIPKNQRPKSVCIWVFGGAPWLRLSAASFGYGTVTVGADHILLHWHVDKDGIQTWVRVTSLPI